ncbi:MAG: DUF4835 family protein [Ignavibacteriae bacterium]|nr:DUF4835 family protein [Ignavibacteriota bacterium]
MEYKMKKIIFLILLLPMLIKAQELDATVLVNYEQLETAAKERLQNFKQTIETYLNSTKFTAQTWEEERIKCTFNIFFTSASGETRYNAQLVVSSQRPIYDSKLNSLMISILDNQWSFEYEKNQPLYFDPLDYNSLNGIFDFYAYVIIGLDMDSYGPDPLGGSESFNQAFQVAIKGANSRFNDGWQSESTSYNKRGLIEDVMDGKYSKFREDYMDYHYNGIDVIDNPKYKKLAQDNIAKLIRNLFEMRDQIDPRSVLMKVFFDAKAGEIIRCLKDYSDKSIFTKLKKLNPSNISKYEEAEK